MDAKKIADYGFTIEIDQNLIEQLETILNCSFIPHDSLYKGEYWLASNSNHTGSIELGYNKDPQHDPKSDPAEEYFFNFEPKDCPTLLMLAGDADWIEIVHGRLIQLHQIRLIKTE